MGLIFLAFIPIILWLVIFPLFVSKKVFEGEGQKARNKFWFKFWGLSLVGYLVGKFSIDFLRENELLPEFIEQSVLAHFGPFIGFCLGAVYVLIAHEIKKN